MVSEAAGAGTSPASSRSCEADEDEVLVEREAAEATNTLHPERVGRGAAARTSPTPCSATAAAGRGSTSLDERGLRETLEGVQRV